MPARLAAELGLQAGAPASVLTANGAVVVRQTRIPRLAFDASGFDVARPLNPGIPGATRCCSACRRCVTWFPRGDTLTLRAPGSGQLDRVFSVLRPTGWPGRQAWMIGSNWPKDLRRAGNQVAGGEMIGFARRSDTEAAGLLDQQHAGRRVPGRQAHLQSRQKRPGRHVGEVEQGGAGRGCRRSSGPSS